jgi:ABC-type dipeptide/oligopeptide/nickel transport system ATPase component
LAGNSGGPLLAADISVEYRKRGAVLAGAGLEVEQGELFALAGESGSGKSTFALSILGLLPPGATVRGTLLFEGQDLLAMPDSRMRRLRGNRISFVPQSPLSSLNPRLRIGAQLREAWEIHQPGRAWKEPVQEALANVSLPCDDGFLRHYAAELSVGMAQRVLIAMAILHRPALILADEATSGLDVITQAEILGLFGSLNRRYGCSILYITHDLASAAALCSRMGILYQGRIVETGPVQQIFEEPQHAYTRRLIAAVPRRPQEPARV